MPSGHSCFLKGRIMAKTKIRSPKKRIAKGPMSRAVMAITFVAAVLLIVLIVNGISLGRKISENNTRINNINSRIEEEDKRTEEISKLQEYMQSDEYLEQTAKEKLGFVKDGEIIFKEKQ